MKKKLLCLFLLLAGGVTLQAQSIPEPLLGVSFGKNGLVLSGTDAANHTGKAYNNGKWYREWWDSPSFHRQPWPTVPSRALYMGLAVRKSSHYLLSAPCMSYPIEQ